MRLNGCLTITNFLVHHEDYRRTGPDADILAVRFPYRRELPEHREPMVDHPVFQPDGRIELMICEVKTGLCDLNGPWTDPERGNMRRVLYAIGALPDDMIDEVAQSLYGKHQFIDSQYKVRLFVFGDRRNSSLHPPIEQLIWTEVLAFIYERLRTYYRVKAQHNQWDRTGRRLYSIMNRHLRDKDEFVAACRSEMELD